MESKAQGWVLNMFCCCCCFSVYRKHLERNDIPQGGKLYAMDQCSATVLSRRRSCSTVCMMLNEIMQFSCLYSSYANSLQVAAISKAWFHIPVKAAKYFDEVIGNKSFHFSCGNYVHVYATESISIITYGIWIFSLIVFQC